MPVKLSKTLKDGPGNSGDAPGVREIRRALPEREARAGWRAGRATTGSSPTSTIQDRVVARLGEGVADVAEVLGVVVHRQNAHPPISLLILKPRRDRRVSSPTAPPSDSSTDGSVKVKHTPAPCPSLSAQMRPPCVSTMPLQMAGPQAMSPFRIREFIAVA